MLKFSQTSWDVRDKQNFSSYLIQSSQLMAELEKLTSKRTSRDEEDGNAHPSPDSPKKQKRLILIRLIKSYLKFCAALLTPLFLVTWFDPRRSQGFRVKIRTEVAGNESVCFLIL